MLRTNRSSLICDRVEYGTIHVHSIDSALPNSRQRPTAGAANCPTTGAPLTPIHRANPVSLNSCRAMAGRTSPPTMQGAPVFGFSR
jgi:hypothetical protein